MFKKYTKNVLDMNKEDFKSFCDSKSDCDGYCSKECPFYNKIICELLRKGLKETSGYGYDNITYGKLFKELKELENTKVSWVSLVDKNK